MILEEMVIEKRDFLLPGIAAAGISMPVPFTHEADPTKTSYSVLGCSPPPQAT